MGLVVLCFKDWGRYLLSGKETFCGGGVKGFCPALWDWVSATTGAIISFEHAQVHTVKSNRSSSVVLSVEIF